MAADAADLLTRAASRRAIRDDVAGASRRGHRRGMRLFLKYATTRATLRRSVKVAALVGTILAIINHYDMLLSGNFTTRRCIQIIVTYFVPFSVSTASSALQGRAMELLAARSPAPSD